MYQYIILFVWPSHIQHSTYEDFVTKGTTKALFHYKLQLLDFMKNYYTLNPSYSSFLFRSLYSSYLCHVFHIIYQMYVHTVVSMQNPNFCCMTDVHRIRIFSLNVMYCIKKNIFSVYICVCERFQNFC